MSQLSSRIVAAVAVMGCLIVTPASAKDKDKAPPRPAQIEQLYACRDIADPAQRLACFDREVGSLASADEAREIVFTDRETAKKTRRGLFGFNFPKLGGIFGGDEDEVREIDTVIKSVSMNQSGKYVMTMEDGAVWSQIDTTVLPRQPKPGQKIHIKTATMGSYFASVEGGRSIRMKRDR
ncbi:MAG: hypothetical protein BGO58_02935 [Sphingopyxis sp. 65-8]|mgnify:FL=1|nr:hypothetical protein [Sphingopyxis terrae]OJW27953.1 MAG: hypothetical protein BGO58_02935 [Sphingopyxis sp. 65-8]